METPKHKVVILYKYIPQYRIRFFELLKERLAQSDIDLLVTYGQPGPKDAKKKDAVDFAGGVYVQNKIFSIGHYEIFWQPILRYIRNADLIILEQASKLLINYVLLLQSAFGCTKLAFWGHGKNFQTDSANPIGEFLKKTISTKVHWWFGYNEMSASVVENLGYPRDRITIVQNSIDTHEIHEAFINQNPEDLAKLRQNLGITNNRVGLYVGGMYAEKRLDFILEACHLIRGRVPDFEMIFVGAGTEAPIVQEASQKQTWIHYVGPKFNLERVPYFAISKVFLMPGAVGLAILDCFTLGVPLITCRGSNHGPEIEYLENGINGILVDNNEDVSLYADTVVSLLKDDQRHAILVEGCQRSRQKFSIEEMVERFADGVEKALKNNIPGPD